MPQEQPAPLEFPGLAVFLTLLTMPDDDAMKFCDSKTALAELKKVILAHLHSDNIDDLGDLKIKDAHLTHAQKWAAANCASFQVARDRFGAFCAKGDGWASGQKLMAYQIVEIALATAEGAKRK